MLSTQRIYLFQKPEKLLKVIWGQEHIPNQKPQDITPIDKYKKLIEKIINLSINEWPTFQESIKRTYSTEIKQTEPCTKTKSNANTNEEIPKENSNVTKSANKKRQRSPIRPPDINRHN